MTITRRLFLGGLLASTCAPAIVRSGVLMPVRPAIVTDIWNPANWESDEYLYGLLRQTVEASFKPTRADPLGQRGWVRMPDGYMIGPAVLNEHWMAAFEGRA